MSPQKRKAVAAGKASPPLTNAQDDNGRVVWVVALGCAVRLCILVLFSDIVARYLSDQVELSTPVTSYKRLREGLFLSANQIPPFDGGIFHQSPLLLLMFGVLHRLPEFFTDLVYVAADGLVALMLARIAASRRARDKNGSPLVPGEIAFSCGPSIVATLYLFNPLTLGTVLAKSTIVFSHLAIAAALCAAVDGRPVVATVWSAVATHLSVYPAMLLAPIALVPPASAAYEQNRRSGRLAKRIATTVAVFALAFGAMHFLFVAFYGIQYFTATFDFVLRVADLQPNVGLFWYFFIEIFDEFRMFFFVVFQLTALAFAVPVAWRFRSDPLFAATILIGIISALKSYPSWGDLSLFLGLLPIFEELFKYMQYTFLSTNLLLYGIGLAPVFWHLWIEQGSGNANFFYAATLVYVFGQITLLFDLGSAMLRRELDIHHPETRTRPVIQD
ncbi:hypothetical protein IW140_003271 [Coemansia sp. RSA 1813]|nr:hypothetical protein EV178_002890 [Coemansia sp. RSA 1646]KAJ1771680.1 hypothetical protein LPJ74_002107 [Coemansia sp. RSA 1843]KAJ2089683.1 hypothetical protein IW138_003281 [Coemansia sp. RSA 986]KAJ2214121.1 hypothetical protein EV179_003260 [Coemansia sp. RSA 487]KAJ2569179.1 hypothetical protein IW140_003271 [Coemansia sp. RSA 1813]